MTQLAFIPHDGCSDVDRPVIVAIWTDMPAFDPIFRPPKHYITIRSALTARPSVLSGVRLRAAHKVTDGTKNEALTECFRPNKNHKKS
jgi:hypothetical protein